MSSLKRYTGLTGGMLILLVLFALIVPLAMIQADHDGAGDLEFIEFVKNNTIGGGVVGLNGAKDVTISRMENMPTSSATIWATRTNLG